MGKYVGQACHAGGSENVQMTVVNTLVVRVSKERSCSLPTKAGPNVKLNPNPIQSFVWEKTHTQRHFLTLTYPFARECENANPKPV